LYGRPYLKQGSSPAQPIFMTTQEAFAAYGSFFSLAALRQPWHHAQGAFI